MKLKKLAISVLLATSCAAFAAEYYNPDISYPAGSQVSFNGDIYEAKWWANPGQSPADAATNPWDTPWELISEGGGTTPPQPPEPPIDPPQPPVEPEGNYPAYAEGTHYEGGDIVQVDGQLYRCKVGPTSAWCSGEAWAYAPGTGTAWVDAWEKITEGDITPPIDPPQPPIDPPQPPVDPDGQYVISQAELDKIEADLTNSEHMQRVKAAVRTLDNATVEQIMPLADTNPENVKRIESIISADDWEFLFSKRAPEYTYLNFLKAAGKFPVFCQTYDDGRDSDAICRKSMATMFGHFAQETGGHTAHWDVPEWRQALVHVREMGWTEDARGGYGQCDPKEWQGRIYPCAKFENGEYKSYFGRGAKQLSYNYNYGAFSQIIYDGDASVLLEKPELVADTWYNLASAVFFFIYPQPPKPSMLEVIDGTWQPNDVDAQANMKPGFGVTTNIINGGLECRTGAGNPEDVRSQNRISYYKSFSEYLDIPVPADELVNCGAMQDFSEGGAGAIKISWEKDWSYDPSKPNNDSYACSLVTYQTGYNAVIEGDYTNCVKYHFPKIVITE